jgi:hypothetical protein
MDNAVALVQAYLRVNGYFTVAEFPILEGSHGRFREVTDLDMLAFRFAGAGHLSGTRIATEASFEVDRELGCPSATADMIIGEVKEGAPKLNAAARKPAVLAAALARFGCCTPSEALEIVENLARLGHTSLPNGHSARMVVFAPSPRTADTPAYRLISLGHVVRFLEEHLRRHWAVFAHAQFKDPALGFLATLEKARREQGDGQEPI